MTCCTSLPVTVTGSLRTCTEFPSSLAGLIPASILYSIKRIITHFKKSVNSLRKKCYRKRENNPGTGSHTFAPVPGLFGFTSDLTIGGSVLPAWSRYQYRHLCKSSRWRTELLRQRHRPARNRTATGHSVQPSLTGTAFPKSAPCLICAAGAGKRRPRTGRHGGSSHRGA